jgi:2-keto-4-pentenoate hydratase/2-oxohepta-3-ene-1,7-dioic acid hydratase in catechol pathway
VQQISAPAGSDLAAAVRTATPVRRWALREVELAPPLCPSKILCVGRNYRAHAEEMGNEVPAEPLLFFKPPSALVASGQPVVRPEGYERVDMEAELVAVIGRRGRRIAAGDALDHVAGYTLGNDVSNRDLQRRDSQWTRAKGFDTFAPLGPFVRLVAPGEALPGSAKIQGWLDGELRQEAPLSAMVFDVAAVIAHVSACMTLEPGDVIYTGTPSGVCPLSPGQTTAVTLAGFDLGQLSNPVVVG